MAEKLKSIIVRIPWSLLLKAGVFGSVWYYGPHWIALVAAVLFYVFPTFPFSGTLTPFVVLIVFASVMPTSGIGAWMLGIVFLLILGSKELVFLSRNRIYETILLFFVFLGSLEFFRNLFHAPYAFSFIQLAAGACGVYLLTQELFQREADAADINAPPSVHPRFAAGLITFVLAEFAGTIALVPMNLFYKTAFVLLAATVLIDLTLQYIQGARSTQGVFVSFAIFFFIAVFMLVSNPWHP